MPMNPRFWKEDNNGHFPNAYAFHFFGSDPPPMPAPPPDHTLELERMRNEREDARRAQEATAKQEAEALARRNFEGNLNRAVSGANDYASQRLSSLGLNDDYGIMSAFQRELTGARGQVPDLATDVGSIINGASLWDKAYTGQRDIQRKKLTNEADMYIGNGFDRRYIADEADDQILNSILGEQFNDAQQRVQRAKERGQLNDSAYSYATKGLNTQKSAASNKLQDLGGGVLSNYRKSLGTIADSARQNIQNYDFGSNFRFNDVRDELNRTAQSSLGRLEGDVRGAVGSQDFFDLDALIGDAISRGGDANFGQVGGPSMASAFVDPNDPNSTGKKATTRTVGNVGVF